MFRIIKDVMVESTPVIIEGIPLVVIEEEQMEESEQDNDTSAGNKPEEIIDLEAIRRQADELLALAQQQTDELLAAANSQVGEIRESARQEGYQAGLQQGQQEGLATGLEEGQRQGHEEGLQAGREQILQDMQNEINAAAEKAAKMLAVAQQEVQAIIAAAEPQIVELALAVASKVLAREIEDNPLITLPIVRRALEKVKDQEKICIRVNPQDYDTLLLARQDLQKMIGREQDLSIASDQTIAVGGCVLDTPYGMVDSRIDTQIELLHKAIRDVLS